MNIKREDDIETDDEGTNEGQPRVDSRVKSEETDDESGGGSEETGSERSHLLGAFNETDEATNNRGSGTYARAVGRTNASFRAGPIHIQIPADHTPTWKHVLPENFFNAAAANGPSSAARAGPPRMISNVREKYLETGVQDDLKIDEDVQFSDNLRAFSVRYFGPVYGLIMVSCNGRVIVKTLQHHRIPASQMNVGVESVKVGDIIVAVNGHLIPHRCSFHKVLFVMKRFMENPPVTVTFARDDDFESLFVNESIPLMALRRTATSGAQQPESEGQNGGAVGLRKRKKADTLASSVSESESHEELKETVKSFRSLVEQQQQTFDAATASQEVEKKRLEDELRTQQRANDGLKQKIAEMEQREKDHSKQISRMASSHEAEVAALRDELKTLRSLLK